MDEFDSDSESAPRSGLHPSLHGVIGTVLVAGFIVISILRQWQVSFLYIVTALVPYAAVFVWATKASRGRGDLSNVHWVELAAHLSLLLLLGGFYLAFPGFWRNVATFLGAIAAGTALSFQFLRR